jgi:hypothetical protein
VTIILRLVQQYLPSHKQPVHALEKQVAEGEHRGILPRDERLAPGSGREPATASSGNVDLTPSRPRRKALKQIEDNPDHTELAGKQPPLFQQSWIEFHELLKACRDTSLLF